jgi:hypothetical protein
MCLRCKHYRWMLHKIPSLMQRCAGIKLNIWILLLDMRFFWHVSLIFYILDMFLHVSISLESSQAKSHVHWTYRHQFIHIITQASESDKLITIQHTTAIKPSLQNKLIRNKIPSKECEETHWQILHLVACGQYQLCCAPTYHGN